MTSQKKIDAIKKACKINDEIFGSLLPELNQKNLRREKDIDNFIRKEIRKRKLSLAFPPVVATSANAAEIHHKPKKTKLKKGFLVIDFGVKHNNYCSDMTRTLYIGKASKKEKQVYSKLLEIQKSAIKKSVPNAECFDIDSFVRKKLGKLREFFVHSLGHGVGKKIHEKPNLSPKSCEKFKIGDIVTIEPGIYVKKKFGIRIEDTILIKSKKPEILTKTTKRLIEIR